MKQLSTLFWVFCALVQIQAQEKFVKGTVTEYQTNTPIPGVTIIVKGNTTGATTDFDGEYELKVNEKDVLVFSYIGFKTKEVQVGTTATIDVVLEPDLQTLDEVVVVGYGVQRKSSVVGAVTSIQAESISKSRRRKQNTNAYHNSIANQLQSSSLSKPLGGKVTGIAVSNSEELNQQNGKIYIRGMSTFSNTKSPLVIVDGITVSHDTLNNLNVNDISNVSVLKDAKASHIYGSKGANGVIIISTNSNYAKVQKQPLYIVDGSPIKKENNHVVEGLSESDILNKKSYRGKEAKKKFGAVAKNGCVVINTKQGNFNLYNDDTYAIIEENSFESTLRAPLSTFSIDVDKASYSNVRRMINNGMPVEPDAVKIEEMVNYFNYNYPQPKGNHPFSINTEVCKTPWHNQTKIVKIGLQGKTFESADLPPSNLTFLIDVSGSMGASNKLPLLKSAFKLLVNQLREKDKVSIVVYAGAAGVVLEPTSGSNKSKIIEALDNLEAGGSTAGGAGITLAYKLAEQNFKKNGNNRVILATDGDFNVGDSSDKAMEKLIEEKRKSGVFLSVLGFGYGNYKDSKLETLADKGNGNHAYIDTMQEAQKVFGKEFGGTLYTIAKDVKIQIEFNPNKVKAYRLIGYENRMLNDEDFVDDKKDAGELGSGHTVTALYEVIPQGVKTDYIKAVTDLKYTKAAVSDNFSNELFTVKFRYKKPDQQKSIEMVHVQKDEVSEPTSDLNFASAVALFGMQLRQSKYHNNSKIEDVIALANKGRGEDKQGYRVEFIRLVSSYQNL
ncbi:VWA domain-containing protein [Seonamhaeicola sp. ML3]|uniref:VWA domain-containing protein n=1 Tax=Seonamhaeicola sp. ML3 TaxID=2937786 RepID=UPI00200FEE9A|nr:VWA domain-containing protein [Seonamhaeicola sp. ML3]